MVGKRGKNFYFIAILKRIREEKTPYDLEFICDLFNIKIPKGFNFKKKKKSYYSKEELKFKEEVKKKKNNLTYYINQLKAMGIVSNPAYAIWSIDYAKLKEVKKRGRVTVLKDGVEIKKSKNIRGHGFKVKLYIPHIKNWDKREEWLKNKKISYKNIKAGFGKYQQILINKWKVWLCSDVIIIYAPRGYSVFAEDSKTSYDIFVSHLAQIINKIEKKLKTRFLVYRPGSNSKVYDFRVFGSHYSHVKSALARLKETEKLKVVNEHGLRFLVDNSFNLLEFEAVSGQNRSMNDITPVKKLVNDVADGKFDIDQQNEFNKNFQKQQEALVDAARELEINIRSHVDTIQKMGAMSVEFTNFVKEVRVFMQKSN